MLTAISPIDGRYASKTSSLKEYYSEYALIRARIQVEVEYFIFLVENNIGPLKEVEDAQVRQLRDIYKNFDLNGAEKVKETEKKINHDVKAVEYYVKETLRERGLGKYEEFVHFGLTSQDINNTSVPILIKESLQEVLLPHARTIVEDLDILAKEWHGIPMLARTHGQAASPTTVGKELRVFTERLQKQTEEIEGVEILGKFGGATGNFNAHRIAFPDKNWPNLGDEFLRERLHLKRSQNTTQIAHYDDLAALFHAFSRFNTILIDLCRDFWTYISMDYFGQKVNKDEVGSSAMPHKVNPIDFENAEGNLGIANALFGHLAEKLPISRLQRDLTDSTVLRNVGTPFGHTLIATTSLLKGMGKLKLNAAVIERDLENNWAVVAEAIQTILRREGFDKPYEALKALTRGNQTINKESIKAFIEELDVSPAVKDELRQITPHNYTGYH